MKLPKAVKFWKLPGKIWIPILIILIGVGIYFFYPKPKEEPVQLTEVKIGGIKSAISTSGTLEGTDSADLKFKISGKLNYIGVKEGQRVNKGTLIASLDTRDLQNTLQQSYNTFVAKEATAKKIEDEVKDHSSDENFTQKEKRKAAQTARDNAYDDIKAAQRALEDAYLYAPISGVVTKADPNPGQIVAVTDVIAQIVDETEYVFEAEVDESDVGAVKVGQKVIVTLNSYPDKTFEATVSKIMPSTQTTDSGATVVIVKLALGKPEINFVQGLNGQSDIITSEVFGVMTIPVEALMDSDEVYVKKGQSYEKVKVETGLRSAISVEINSGLKPDQTIVTNPGAVNSDKGNWMTKLISR